MKLPKKITMGIIAGIIALPVFANYTIIIPMDYKSDINFIPNPAKQWVPAAPKFLQWTNTDTSDPFYRYECTNWTPDKTTINQGVSFQQTATNCKGKQYAEMVNQEKNLFTKEIRNVGSPFIDKIQENLLTNQTSTKTEIGTKAVALMIKDPVAGQSGIYDISNGKGGTFKAYVNMTDNGGNWILLSKWTASTGATPVTTFNDVVVKGKTVLSTTNNSTTYPVIPSGTMNDSSNVLFKSANATWISLYGTWQSFPTFSTSSVVNASGFGVTTSIGSKTMYMRANGWPAYYAGTMTQYFGLWTVYGNSGPCGGDGRGGSNPICPSIYNDVSAHFDRSSDKELYLKATN